MALLVSFRYDTIRYSQAKRKSVDKATHRFGLGIPRLRKILGREGKGRDISWISKGEKRRDVTAGRCSGFYETMAPILSLGMGCRAREWCICITRTAALFAVYTLHYETLLVLKGMFESTEGLI